MFDMMTRNAPEGHSLTSHLECFDNVRMAQRVRISPDLG